MRSFIQFLSFALKGGTPAWGNCFGGAIMLSIFIYSQIFRLSLMFNVSSYVNMVTISQKRTGAC